MAKHKIYSINGTAQAVKYSGGANDIVPDTGLITGAKAPAKKLFNYGMMTEGEMDLSLMLEMINLKQAAYQDPSGIYTRAKTEIENRLRAGLHTAGQRTVTGSQPAELNRLFTNIQAATRKGNPAGMMLNADLRPSINAGFDPNNPPTQLVDCAANYQAALANLSPLGEFDDPIFNANVESQNAAQIQQAQSAFELCQLQNKDINALNELIPAAAPSLLYAHDVNGNYSPLYNVKASSHLAQLKVVSVNSSLSLPTLLLWSRYGVMLNSYKQNNGLPHSPEDIITAFRSNGLARRVLLDNNIDPSILDDPRFANSIGVNGIIVTLVVIGISALFAFAVLEAVSKAYTLKKTLDYSLALAEMGLAPLAPDAIADLVSSASFSGAEYARMTTDLTTAGLLAGAVTTTTDNGTSTTTTSTGVPNNTEETSSNNTGLLIGGGILAFALLNNR